MPREPEPNEKEKVKFANSSYTGRHNITRLDKKIQRAWCNDCMKWVGAVRFEKNGSWHCRNSYRHFMRKIDSGII